MLAGIIALNFPIVAIAAAPDAGQILRDTKPAAPLPPTRQPEENIVPEAAKPVAQPSPSDDVRVTISHFTFTGNVTFSQEVLHAAIADAENKPLNFGELMAVVDKVEAVYKKAGFFLAQAYLPPQKIKDGTIEISVSEGLIGQSRLEGESRIKPKVVFAYLDQLPKGAAVKLTEIERQILLINDLAGSRATLDLQSSDEAGKTDIVIAQKQDPLITGRVELNNHGMQSTGKNRTGVFLNMNSPLKRGDRLNANWVRSENGDLASYGLNYDLPIGAQGFHINAGTSLSQYSLGGDFASLQASGTVRTYHVGTSYSVLRSRNTNLVFRLDAAHNDLQDNFKASDQYLDKFSNVITAGANLDWLDEWLGGGSNRAEVTLSAGKLNLGAAALAQDTNFTDGRYGKALLTLQRDQTITTSVMLQAQALHQIALKNLDSSEKFSIGGPTTLPGYASGEASGDEGTLLKLKLNWRVRNDMALGLFADYAHIDLAHNPLAGTDNKRHFSDAGLSLDWQGTQGLTASMLVAWAGGEKPNPADNDRPRFWANVGYNW
ncbi:FhaC Hemolysin activation/secretion protein [Methylophilaceae bacterium]